MQSSDPRPGRPGRRSARGPRALSATLVGLVLVGAVGLMIVRERADDATPAVGASSGPVELANPAPTVQELEGIWSLDGGRHLLRFATDGTYVLDDGGRLPHDPADAGTYSVYGSTLTFVAGDASRCEQGRRREWQVEVLGDGRLHGVVTSDPCAGLSDETWTRVSPDSRLASTPTRRPTTAEPPGELAALEGVWLVDGSSTLVAMSTDGTYAWDDRGRLDTAPADTGTVELDGATLTFTSERQSATCGDGDTLVLEDVGLTADATARHRLFASVDRSTCADVSGEVSFTRVS